jgi:hypothetical protein
MRTRPLPVPASNDTGAWQGYRFELGQRIFGGEALSFGGIVLAAPGAKWGGNAEEVRSWIAGWRPEPGHHRKFLFVSPTSGLLADALVTSMQKRKPGSMKGLHTVFVGSAPEGRRVSDAGGRVGALLRVGDRSKPFARGKPLPLTPPDYFIGEPEDHSSR